MLPGKLPRSFADRLGRSVARPGITPNMISVAGFLGNAGCAVLIGAGYLVPAGITYLLFSALDLVDGAVARATGRATPFGAVLDAVLDRLSEGLVLAGAAWYFAGRGEWWQVAAVYVAISASIAVSYLRALSEAAGHGLREGLLRRQERVVLLGLGLLLGLLTWAVAALAALALITAGQRTWMAARTLRAEGPGRRRRSERQSG